MVLDEPISRPYQTETGILSGPGENMLRAADPPCPLQLSYMEGRERVTFQLGNGRSCRHRQHTPFALLTCEAGFPFGKQPFSGGKWGE